jgi:acyl-lipid omega-6 desaturase (Delta-12 desaturase)
MREGKELILATKRYASENRPKSWFYTLSTLFILLLCYAGIFYNFHPLVSLFFSLLTGLVLVRMFVIYHDYMHHTILQRSAAANVIFTIFGLFILAPKSIWKRSHDYHHQHNSKLYTSSIGSFPIVTKKKFLSFDKKDRFFYLFIRHPLTIVFGYVFMFILGMCIRSFASNPRKHWDSVIALALHLVIGVSVFYFFGWQGLLLGFFLPFLVAESVGSYLFYAQHNFPDATFEDKDGWTYVNAAMNSSSYMIMGPLMHWFTGNIGYHHIHHLNSRIPFYRLPEIYRDMPELQAAKTTNLLPGEIVRCLRLKVWDPEAGRMIGHKEIAYPVEEYSVN